MFHQIDEKNNLAGADKSPVRPELIEIFADIFQFDGDLSPGTSGEEVKRWDSLQHVGLVATLEDRFGISISLDEMMEITDVAAIQRVLERHGV